LPSRIEPAEPDLKKYWRFGDDQKEVQGYQPLFEELFKDVYELPKCDLAAYFDEVQIQHVPRYSYGEEIAVLIELGADRLSLKRSYENFTDRLVNATAPWESVAQDESEVQPVSFDSGVKGKALGGRTTLWERIIKRPTQVAAAVAILVLLGILSVNLLSGNGLSPDPTPSPTLLGAGSDKTSTPTAITTASATSTRTSTPTSTITPSITPVPPPGPPGVDLELGCVHSANWTLHPEQGVPDPRGCLELLDLGLSASAGLQIAQPNVVTGDFGLRGIHAEAPNTGIISFKLRIDELESKGATDVALMFGVIPTKPTDLDNGSFISFVRGRLNSPLFVEITEPGSSEVVLLFEDYRFGEQELEVRLEIDGLSLQIFLDDVIVGGPLNLAFSNRAFWIGYNFPLDAVFRAFLFDLSITEP
jgi:hypothetical protein